MKVQTTYIIPAGNKKALAFFDDLARRKEALRVKLEKRMQRLQSQRA